MLHRAITDHYKKLKSFSKRPSSSDDKSDSTIPLTRKNVARQIKRDNETNDLVESVKSDSGSNASEVRNGKDLIVRLKKTIIEMHLDTINETISNGV